jgi:hypothetical protein
VQVRSIEFQEHFGRVPVETSRQQSLLLREPALAQQQAGQVMADQHVLDMSRPRPTTETEGTIIDPDGGRASGRQSRSGERRRDSDELAAEEEKPSRDPRTAGRKLDVVA